MTIVSCLLVPLSLIFSVPSHSQMGGQLFYYIDMCVYIILNVVLWSSIIFYLLHVMLCYSIQCHHMLFCLLLLVCSMLF